MKKPLSLPITPIIDQQFDQNAREAGVRLNMRESERRACTGFDPWFAEQGCDLLRPRELRFRSSLVRKGACISRPTVKSGNTSGQRPRGGTDEHRVDERKRRHDS